MGWIQGKIPVPGRVWEQGGQRFHPSGPKEGTKATELNPGLGRVGGLASPRVGEQKPAGDTTQAQARKGSPLPSRSSKELSTVTERGPGISGDVRLAP